MKMTKNERLGLIALACVLASIVCVTLLNRHGDEDGSALPVTVVASDPVKAVSDTVVSAEASSSSTAAPSGKSRKSVGTQRELPPQSNVRDPRSQNVTR